jgi:hypothetical protein
MYVDVETQRRNLIYTDRHTHTHTQTDRQFNFLSFLTTISELRRRRVCITLSLPKWRSIRCLSCEYTGDPTCRITAAVVPAFTPICFWRPTFVYVLSREALRPKSSLPPFVLRTHPGVDHFHLDQIYSIQAASNAGSAKAGRRRSQSCLVLALRLRRRPDCCGRHSFVHLLQGKCRFKG